MKWIASCLMILIIVLGLHYTGFITLFKDQDVTREWNSIPSPHLQTQTLNGKKFALSDFRGKIVLLNFWASWCKPCYEEFPELIQALNWFQKNQIHLVAISVDESKQDVKSFLKKMKFKEHPNFHLVWDPKYAIADQFHVIRLPETFILNKQLEIIKKQVGLFSFEETQIFLQPFLK